MHGSAQPEERSPATHPEDAAGPDQRATVGDKSDGRHSIEEMELDSALQLLVERAQYITGATGTALALPQGGEMVCRASAGASAPAIGASLQVRSGLTGESIARRQLLRCDNAEADPRVNLETCRALGIASIVVLPLLRRDGEVRGLFELFSDHPYAFEERDLIALERMAALTSTALDLAEHQQHSATAAPAFARKTQETVETPAAETAAPALENQVSANPIPEIAAQPILAESTVLPPTVTPAEVLPDETPVVLSSISSAITVPIEPEPSSAPASVPAAMLRVQKCTACGFPVSEGRTLCLDCEKKDGEKKDFEKKQRETEQVKEPQLSKQGEDQGLQTVPASDAATPAPEEFVPAFLANAVPANESWAANHVNVLAIVALILAVLVAVVIFR